MSKKCLNSSEMSNVLKALNIANKRIDQLEKYNLDLANESHNKSRAIDRANERIKELEKELSNEELLHVGFTNGDQVKYAKVEEGAFYPDTSGNCYIPLYMLKCHEYRIEITSIDLRKEQENG